MIVIVLDGFGIGAMPDVEDKRKKDIGAHTFKHISQVVKDLSLPSLEKLGLANAAEFETAHIKKNPEAIYGRSMLMHDGADTFFGHQEIMGTKPVKAHGHRLKDRIHAVEAALLEAGHEVRRYACQGEELLIVNNILTVADNIECDPGQAINVSACLDGIAYDDLLAIGRVVRAQVSVPRVIVFGGRKIRLDNLLNAVEIKWKLPSDGNREALPLIGVNAPASGVYLHDYHCEHMGYGIDPTVQVPYVLGKWGLPVFLLGKVADVVANPFGTSIPMVDTAAVLDRTLEIVEENPHAFICTNVQETDLSGHRESCEAYAKVLEIADAKISTIIDALADEDLLIVMADHGNDPTIGHPQHTREFVPLLIHAGFAKAQDLGTRQTLADIAATAFDFFEHGRAIHGKSFLPELRQTFE